MVTRASGRAALIMASMSPAVMAMPGPPSGSAGWSVHPGREETFVRVAQRLDGYGSAVGQCQILPATITDADRRHPGGLGGGDGGDRVGDGEHVAALVLAEPEAVAGDVARPGGEAGAGAAGHRHLRDGDEQAAIGDVVAGAHPADLDLAAHEVAVAALGGEVHRGRRALLLADDLAQPKGLAEPALRVADQHKVEPGGEYEPDRGG